MADNANQLCDGPINKEKYHVSELELYQICIAHILYNTDGAKFDANGLGGFKEALNRKLDKKPRLSKMYRNLHHNTTKKDIYLKKLYDLNDNPIHLRKRCQEFYENHGAQMNQPLRLVPSEPNEKDVCTGTSPELTYSSMSKSFEEMVDCPPKENGAEDTDCINDVSLKTNMKVIGANYEFVFGGGGGKDGICATKMPSLTKLHRKDDTAAGLIWNEEVSASCGPIVVRHLNEVGGMKDELSSYAQWAWCESDEEARHNPTVHVYTSSLGNSLFDSGQSSAENLLKFDSEFANHHVGVITLSALENGKVMHHYTQALLTRSNILELLEVENSESQPRRIFCNEVMVLAPIMHADDILDYDRCFTQTLTLKESFANMSGERNGTGILPNASDWAHMSTPTAMSTRAMSTRAMSTPTTTSLVFRYSYWTAVALLLCALFVKMYLRFGST